MFRGSGMVCLLFRGILILFLMRTCLLAEDEAPVEIRPSTVAIEVGAAQVTYFELAQRLGPLLEKSEGIEPLGSIDVDSMLAPVVSETTRSAIGIEQGILATDEFRNRLRNVQKSMIWQNSAVSQVVKRFDLNFLENGDCLMIARPVTLGEIAGNLRFLVDVGSSSSEDVNELTLMVFGQPVQVFRESLREFRKRAGHKRPGTLVDLLKDAMDPDTDIIWWSYGEISGTYSVGDFLEDYEDSLMKSSDSSGPAPYMTVIEKFFTREYYEQALRSGLVDELNLKLGFPAFARRYVRGTLEKQVRAEINEPSGEELTEYFRLHAQSILIPELIRIKEYLLKSDDYDEALAFQRSLAYPEIETNVPGKSLEEIGASVTVSERNLAPGDPEFLRFLRLRAGRYTSPSPVVDTGGFVFYEVVEHEGSKKPSLSDISELVVETLNESKVEKKLQSMEQDFLATHRVKLHPLIESVIQSEYFRSLIIVQKG